MREHLIQKISRHDPARGITDCRPRHLLRSPVPGNHDILDIAVDLCRVSGINDRDDNVPAMDPI